MKKNKTYQIVEVTLLVLALMFITSGCERKLTNSIVAETQSSDPNQSSKYLNAMPNTTKEESKYLQPASFSFKPAFMDTKADLILTGPTEAYTQYGNYPRFGDVNGDGYEDLLVAGAWHYNEKQGRLYLYYGGKDMDDEPDKIFTGEEIGQGFGSEATLADINGDGYADVVTGAAEYNNQQGRVYIFYGGSDMDEKADVVIDGEAGTQGYFGHVINAGDVNNDGYKDVIVSAVFYNNNKGRVYLFYGGNPMDTTPDVIFDGKDEKDHYFGRDINNPKVVGDVNGDGYGDLLLSSRYWNYAGGASGQGRACLYYGGPGTSMDAIPDKVFTGENPRDDFGAAPCIFDIDNDGFDDVIISARYYRCSNGGQGRVYLYWGGKDMDTIPDEVFESEPGLRGSRSSFGCGLDAGHVNEDNYGDIVVAAPFYDKNPWSGRAYLFYGSTKESINTTCDKVFTLPTEKQNGSQHVALGDIDNDKCLELAIGGPEYNNSQGRVWLYDNKPPGSSDESPISLQEAATAGDIDETKTLISKGVDIDTREWGSLRTSLHNAVEQGHKKIVELLLSAGADVNVKDGNGRTPLFSAIQNNDIDLVKLLLAVGADANLVDNDGFPPLYYTVVGNNLDLVKLFLEQSADVNAKDKNGVTALYIAVNNDNKEIVKLLIDEGVDVNVKNEDGQTPLDIILNRNQRQISRNPNHEEIRELLLANGAEILSIHSAVQSADIEKVKEFLEQGTDINSKNGDGLTALHIAANNDFNDITEFLIGQGADVNAKDEGNYTPLYYAIFNINKDIVSLLVDKGTDVNVTPEKDYPPLHYAVWMGDLDIVKTLVDKGAKSDVKVLVDEMTALHYAALQGSRDMVELFLSKGINTSSIHMAACAGDLAKVKEFIEKGVEIDAKDEAGWTALVWAVSAGQADVTEFLIDNNADVNITYGRQNQSLLHQAAQTDSVELIELLIDRGIDVNIPNSTGQTPLHLACRSGNKEVVELLIDKGADVNAKPEGAVPLLANRTPLYTAVMLGNQDIVEILVNRDAEVTTEVINLAEQRGYTEIVEVLQQRSNVYDVGLTNISAPTSCVQGEIASVSITLENLGEFSGSRDVVLIDTTNNKEISRQSATIQSKHIPASEIDLTFDGGLEGRNWFGSRIAVGGDVNGDGYPDFLVNSALYPAGDARGRAYLYYGGPNMTGIPDKIFTGENDGDMFSDGIYQIADLNNDGFADLLLGAPNYGGSASPATGYDGAGRLYIYYGGLDMDEVADIVIDSPDGENCYFGFRPAASDINNDGFLDLVVSAPYYNNRTGRVYLYYGPITSDSTVDKIFTGEKAGDQFGMYSIPGGDIDNDGYNDLVIVTRYYSNSTGRGYLFWGAEGTSMDEDCDMIFSGIGGANSQFGCGIDVSDIDKDGYADVIIGSQGRYYSSIGQGVWLYWGGPRDSFDNSADMIFTGEGISDDFGNTIHVGYAGKDQYPDIMINAFSYGGGLGRSYLYYGGTKEDMDNVVDLTFDTAEILDPFHTFIIDLNNDGYYDILRGGYAYNNRQGRAYIWYGPFNTTANINFIWDTINASIGTHTLQVEIPLVEGEQNTEDNVKTITIEVTEPTE